MIDDKRLYTTGEEIANAVTHGVGAGLSIVGTILLINRAVTRGGTYEVVSAAIFGASLIILYMMSTLYHSIALPRAKKVFRIFDHCTIFVLIAGTYTPFTLITLRGWVGFSIFSVLWGLTALGIVLNSINLEKAKKFSMISYIVMGWCIIFAARPAVIALGLWGTLLLLVGGLFYTVGIIFYKMKGRRYMHSVWHLFVLVGSITQFFAVYFYVLN